MKFVSIKPVLLLSFILISASVFAQDQDTMESETVTVIKQYSPSVRDASKLKVTPPKTDSVTTTKKTVNYKIFSVPVASTFTPVKGRATKIKRERAPKIYDNYASLGVGNYTNILAEFYSNIEVNRDDNLGVYFLHNSSQGGIDEAQLDDKFYNTSLGLNYGRKDRDFAWKVGLGGQHQLYNWYGLPENLLLTNEEKFSIDPQQNYYSVFAEGEFELYGSIFDKANIQIRQSGDASGTSEQLVDFGAQFNFNINDIAVNTDVTANYVNGEAGKTYLYFIDSEVNEYSFLNLGISPGIVYLRDDLTLNIGVSLNYSADTKNSENSFYVYPKISASYNLVDDYFIPYAGINGSLNQNSYYNFVQENPYVSPTLAVKPTNNQYNAFLGAKGKLSNSISYNFRGSYQSLEDKALFRRNVLYATSTKGFEYGNSFGVLYDDIKVASFFAEISADLSSKFQLGVNGEVFSYDSDNQSEAWNMPDYKASVMGNYTISDKWIAGVNLFLVGERKDLAISDFSAVDGGITESKVTLDSYFDANAQVRYKFTDRLSVFVKGSNLFNNDYQRWINFNVQGLQVLGGLTYKFDYN